MIFIVHSLYFVFKFALKLFRRHRAIKEFQQSRELRLRGVADADDEHLVEECLEFDPPAYRQRYAAVQQVLLDERWRSDIRRIVDFGCSEMGFFQYMKHLFGVTEVLEIDVDSEVLVQYKYRIEPLTADYLKQRSDPLVIRILCGSVCDPDPMLTGIDAVVAIELIEHLYPDTLESLPHNVFGFIKPRIAIFTTPNADFNILFPNFKGFRHWDHKFEWTRQQFEDWAHNIILRYPQYSVHFEGIAKGPKGTESLGCCSQMAIFVKEYSAVNLEVPGQEHRAHTLVTESFGVCSFFSYMKQLTEFRETSVTTNCDTNESNYYKLISTATYPYKIDLRTTEEKILHEAMYAIYKNANADSRFYNEETNMVEIPLYEIISNFEGYFVSEPEIRKILLNADFTIEECYLHGLEKPCMCVVYDINMDRHSSPPTSECDKSEHELECNITSPNDTESDWDCEYEQPLNRYTIRSNTTGEQRKENVSEETASSPLSNLEQLFDSGYQKSISNAEWSPQSPLDGTFEEQFSSYLKLDVNDIKDSIKANNQDATQKQINNKVNSERKNFAGSSRKSPQKESEPGTSDARKKRKCKKPDSDDDNVDDELRTLADCIVYNSLNKLDILDDAAPVDHVIIPVIEPEPPYVVENGDLANNNRDDEGNNYPDDVPEPEPFIIDDANNANENRENIEDNAEIVAAPIVNQDHENRNNIIDEAVHVPVPVEPNHANALAALVDYDDDESEAAATTVDTTDIDDSTLNHASREALFDPDSQLDMLDEVPLSEGRNPNDDPVEMAVVENDVVMPDYVNPFPNWLLQLLGQQGDEEANHDEPHFYCQGDGLGVHPSIIEVDVDDSSSDSSSNDDAQAEQTISEDDVGSLPVDVSSTEPASLVVVGQAVPLRPSASVLSNDSNEEFYDTIDDGAENCPGTDKK